MRHYSNLSGRRICRIDSSEAGLIGKCNKSIGSRYTFVYAKNDSSTINLNESYFSISGSMNYELFKGMAFCTDNLSFNDQWLLSLFRNIELRIDNTRIQFLDTPAIIANLKTSLTANFNDVATRRLNRDMIHIGSYNESDTILARDSSNAIPEYGEISLEGDKSINMVIPFSVNMRLKYIFDLPFEPISNHSIQIILNRESHCIPCITDTTKVSKLVSLYSVLNSLTIDEFKKFELNLIEYDSTNKTVTKINRVDETPNETVETNETIEVVTDQVELHGLVSDYQLVSMTSNTSGSNFSYQDTFKGDVEFVALFVPKNSNNELVVRHGNHIDENEAIDINYKYLDEEDKEVPESRLFVHGRGVNSTPPFAHRYVPLNNIEFFVNRDSSEQRIYNNDKTNSKMTFDRPQTSDNQIYSEMALNDTDYYDELRNYNTYLECRNYYGMTDDSACSFEEFIIKYFAIYIPLSTFKLKSGDGMRFRLEFAHWHELRNPLQNTTDNTINSMIVYTAYRKTFKL